MKTRWLIATTLLVIIVVFTFIKWLPNFSINFSGAINWPIKKIYKISSSIRLWTSASSIFEENQKLKELVSANVVDYVNLSRLQNENAALRKELDFVREKKVNIVVASIVGRQILNRSTIIIDRGSRHGLEVGQVATVGGGIVIGKIVQVFDQQATILLLTDPKSQLAVTPATVSGTNGMVVGQTGNSLLLDYVPQTTALSENDLIVTSGLEDKIPSGLLVAKVGNIISRENDIFKQARLVMPVQYDAVENISIVVGNYAQNTN